MSKKVVLEEEEYVEALGQIIERDFFPDLPKLKQQTELLQEDKEGYSHTGTTLRAANTRGNGSIRSSTSDSGWDQPTPTLERDERDEENTDHDEIKASMTLNRFVATHTSEDNESFQKLQEKAVTDHQRRYHWAFDEEERGDPKLHLLTNGTWISKEQRRIADEVCAPKGPKDDRPSAPETWKFRARNPLLFPPELKATREICRVEADSKGQLLLDNGLKSRSERPPKARKTTVYENSRFSSEDVQIVSDSRDASSSSQSDYPLVAMTPIIAPGVDSSPLMTWGDIEGTPERIFSTPSFELQDKSRREKLADRLEVDARNRHPTSRITGIKTPSRKRSQVKRSPVSRSVRSRLSTPLGSDPQLRASYSTPLRPPQHPNKTRRTR